MTKKIANKKVVTGNEALDDTTYDNRFCELCGEKLRVFKVDGGKYIPETGYRKLYKIGECPRWKRSWWSGTNGHDRGYFAGAQFYDAYWIADVID